MIVRFEITSSTMVEAARLAEEGAPHLTVAVADRQTAGQGRHGHSWISPEGGLYCTFVLRMKETLPVITLALGLAVAEAVKVPCDLRWPNDVMIGDRKLCGILAVFQSDVVLAGIGVNLTDPGSSGLAWIDGVTRDQLLDRLIPAVEKMIHLSPADIIQRFTEVSTYAKGKRVHVEGYGYGVTEGLSSSGFLQLRKDDGSLVTVVSGGVRPA